MNLVYKPFYILILLCFSLSCSEEKEYLPPPSNEAKVHILYIRENTTPQTEYPDINSLIYVYYDIDEDLYNYNINRSNITETGFLLDLNNKEVHPDNIFKVDDNGIAKFNLRDNSHIITIVTISNFYNRSSISRFLENIDYTIVYKPIKQS